MSDDLDDIRRRLSALENANNSDAPPATETTTTKTKRKPSAYNIHMKNRIEELQKEAADKGVKFDRKAAFSQAAKEWTSKKN